MWTASFNYNCGKMHMEQTKNTSQINHLKYLYSIYDGLAVTNNAHSPDQQEINIQKEQSTST